MKTVMYFNKKNRTNFKPDFLENISGIENETVSSLEDLLATLCRPLNEISVVIAVPFPLQDLKDLVEMAPVFDRVRMILVLPERSQKLLALGTKLSPSFVTYRDNDVKDIISVLNKIKKRGE